MKAIGEILSRLSWSRFKELLTFPKKFTAGCGPECRMVFRPGIVKCITCTTCNRTWEYGDEIHSECDR